MEPNYRTLAILFLLVFEHIFFGATTVWDSISIPESHVPFYLKNNPFLKKNCLSDNLCPFKKFANDERCWGYEADCPKSKRLSNPVCGEDSRGWANSKKEQEENFWKAADFGLVKERSKELKQYCVPENDLDSSLECVDYLRYCRAKHIWFDLTSARISSERNRYREDVLNTGQVGGHCKLDEQALLSQSAHKSPLQSWYAELQHFNQLDFRPSDKQNCDIIFDKPTFIIKLDAGVNMYHHFCDFVNLYVSQHINNSFSTDVNIVMWDTSGLPYGDFFSLTWKAFTDHPIIPLKDLENKRVCFKEAIFPLLARARFGLYYNMPLIPGCHGSSLIQAFSQHVLHRLSVLQAGPLKKQIRITLLTRSTKYRNILNQNQLVSAMKTDGEFRVTVIDYNRDVPFSKQLETTHNSDIFIGIHGSGLTHMLFLPSWAVVMEIYNCEDPGCYSDLARLRGIKYMTWQKKDKLHQEDEGHHPTLGAHAKFTNFGFDVTEFMRLVNMAANHVRDHPDFRHAQERFDEQPDVDRHEDRIEL